MIASGGKKQAALWAALMCVACSPDVEFTSFQKIEGNQFKVESGQTSSWFGNDVRFVSATTEMGAWRGSYAGGEPMIGKRKDILMSIVSIEAYKICMGQKFSIAAEPDFGSMDIDDSPYFDEDGLFGDAIESDTSEDENLPTGVTMQFYCPSDAR